MTCASDPDRYHVVVSAENSPYMAWQCKLFHFSCVSRLHRTPVLIDEQKEDLRCGTPYVIPAGSAPLLAETWLAAVDAFEPRRREDVMYAFGLAAVKLGLGVTLTRFVETNYWSDAAPTADAIHYCYGDETWSKRQYFTEEQARGVWEPRATAPRGTVLGEILSQIQEARDFYRDPC